jgi:hypothetical protein
VAEVAITHYAFEEAARLARRASPLLPPGMPATRVSCELRIVLAEALIGMGQGREGKEIAVQAAASARQLGEADLLARAALVFSAEGVPGRSDIQMVSLLREALAAIEPRDSSICARLTARLAAALMPPKSEEDYLQNVALAREATAMARRLGDRHTLLYVLQFGLNASGMLTANDDRAALLEEIIELARTHGQRLVLVHHLGSYAGTLVGDGKRVQADLAVTELEALLADPRQAQHQWRVPMARALFVGLDGDFAEAERLSETARTLAQQVGSTYGLHVWTQQRFSLAYLHGELTSLAKDAAALLGVVSQLPTRIRQMPMAAVLAAVGRRDEATRRLHDATLGPSDVVGSVFGALACLTLEDREAAERFYVPLSQLAGPHRLLWGLASASVFGPISRIVGDLALLTGRPAEAVRHHDEALAVCARVGSPALEALCRRSRDRALARLAVSPGPRASEPPVRVLEPVGREFGPKREPVRMLEPAGREFGPKREPVRMLEPAGREFGPKREPLAPPSASPRIDLRREGDIWALAHGDRPAVRLKHSKGLGYLHYLLEQPGRETHVLELVGTEHAVGDAGPVLDARAKAEYRQRLDDLRDELEEGERFGDPGRVAHAQSQIEAIAEQLAGAVGLGGRDRRAASDVERARVNVQRRLKDTVDRIAAADASLGRYLNAVIKTGMYCSYNPV